MEHIDYVGKLKYNTICNYQKEEQKLLFGNLLKGKSLVSMKTFGVGRLAPVDSYKTEEIRAKNGEWNWWKDKFLVDCLKHKAILLMYPE